MGLEKYELLEQLLVAGPSTFFRGRSKVLGNDLLIRRLEIDPTRADDVHETFYREQRHGAGISHPHVQRALDVLEADGYLWSIHEYRPITSTREVVEKDGPLGVARAARLGAQVADALDAMHARGFVHGRVTPRNVLEDDRGEAMLINLVKSADLAAGIWPLRPAVLGLSPFSAPEEFRLERPTPQADVYGLAATAVWWLTKRWPRGGEDEEEAHALAAAGAPAIDIRALRPEVPPALANALLAALEPDPAERHGSAAALGSRLVETWQRLAAEIPSGFHAGATLAPSGAAGPVRIEGRHGSGAFGVVLRARSHESARLLAVKALKPEHRGDQDAHERFLREARAMQAIDHPNVVRIRGVGEEHGTPYAVMDFIPGPDLGSLLLKEGRFPPLRAARLAAGIAHGLEAIHREGIIHRDLKPHNVLVAPGDRPVIADFGVAREIAAPRLTMTGGLLGTPAYMAPEQIENGPSTPAMDLYALGAMLYEMLSGSVPFPTRDPLEAIRLTLHGTPPPLPPDVPPALAGATLRLLEKDPADRPVSAGVAAEMIERAAGLLQEASAPTASA